MRKKPSPIRPRLQRNLSAPGNRGSFRVMPRWIGVHCERVRRTQLGKWWIQCPSTELDTHREAGICWFYSITGSQLLLLPPHLPLLCPHVSAHLNILLSGGPLFMPPVPSPLSASAFLSNGSLSVFSPFSFQGRIWMACRITRVTHYWGRTLFRVTSEDEGQFMDCVLGPRAHSESNR